MEPFWLEIGVIVAPYSVRGEVKVLSSSDFPQRFQTPGRRWLQSDAQTPPWPLTLKRGRPLPGKNIFIVQFQEIGDRQQAEALVAHRLLIPQQDSQSGLYGCPLLAADEYHVLDLLDLEVYLQESGELLGRVTDVYEAGNDLLVVTPITGGAPFLIPFVKAIVPEVNLKQKRLTLTPPPGLLALS